MLEITDYEDASSLADESVIDASDNPVDVAMENEQDIEPGSVAVKMPRAAATKTQTVKGARASDDMLAGFHARLNKQVRPISPESAGADDEDNGASDTPDTEVMLEQKLLKLRKQKATAKAAANVSTYHVCIDHSSCLANIVPHSAAVWYDYFALYSVVEAPSVLRPLHFAPLLSQRKHVQLHHAPQPHVRILSQCSSQTLMMKYKRIT